MSVRIRLTSRLLPMLVALAAFLQIIDPSKAWMVILVILGGGWFFAWLWVRRLAAGLHFSREMRYGWAQVGDELEERFVIENKSIIPATWLEIRDFSTMPDYRASMVTAVGAESTTELFTHGRCLRRGLYTLGTTTLETGDPLGIYLLTITDPGCQTLLVLPPVVPLPPIDITPGGFSGDGRPRAHSPEQSVGAAGVREYQPGDALRLIHWPTSARHGKTFVRLLDGTPSADWWILLDLDSVAQVGTGWNSTEEHAVILAASFADRGLQSHKAVGLAINGQQFSWLPPRSSQEQRWLMLRSLATARPGSLPLAQFLQRGGKSIGKHSSLIIITANLNAEWWEALAPLRWSGNIVPTIMLLDPASFGGVGDASLLAAVIQKSGISCHVITRDLLDRPESHPGHAGQWEWRTSATGKVTATRRPLDVDWRKLG